VFAGLVLLYTICSFSRAMFLFKSILASNSSMLKRINEKVLRSKIVFFDSNPIGRIITRFTKDVVGLDLMLPVQLLMCLQGVFRSIAVIITICIINPWVLLPVAVIFVLMIVILKLGARHMGEAQRMDSLEREPIHSTFSMMITGLTSLRVAEKIPFFKQEFMNSLQRGANATFCNNGISCWMGIRLDLLCVLFTSSVTWFCLIYKGHVRTAILIVTLQFISDLIAWFSYSIRLYADLCNFMTCS
jgi:ATP-binding cassette, subfamily C (CFTR/MRP), member 4